MQARRGIDLTLNISPSPLIIYFNISYFAYHKGAYITKHFICSLIPKLGYLGLYTSTLKALLLRPRNELNTIFTEELYFMLQQLNLLYFPEQNRSNHI
jgi:hypothetical protein